MRGQMADFKISPCRPSAVLTEKKVGRLVAFHSDRPLVESMNFTKFSLSLFQHIFSLICLYSTHFPNKFIEYFSDNFWLLKNTFTCNTLNNYIERVANIFFLNKNETSESKRLENEWKVPNWPAEARAKVARKTQVEDHIVGELLCRWIQLVRSLSGNWRRLFQSRWTCLLLFGSPSTPTCWSPAPFSGGFSLDN